VLWHPIVANVLLSLIEMVLGLGRKVVYVMDKMQVQLVFDDLTDTMRLLLAYQQGEII
jgi:hypothetical protein